MGAHEGKCPPVEACAQSSAGAYLGTVVRFTSKSNTRNYPPVGQCIYCRTREEPLKREHIVPLGLGGTHVLPKASCECCERITGRLEGYCLQHMWGALRGRAGFPSRKMNKRPKTVAVSVEHFDGSSGLIDVPVEDYPAMLGLPVFPAARVLKQLPDEPNAPVPGARWWMWYEEDKLRDFALRHGVRKVHSQNIRPDVFSRMLVKIAHAKAVSEIGVDGFTPYGVDFILRGSAGMNYLVGCWANQEEPEMEHAYHVTGIREHPRTPMILIDVRLFAGLGAPTYHVVVGTKNAT